jgi:DUF1365 family protein
MSSTVITAVNDPWLSAIYEGTVRHRRYTPKYHGFTYRVFMVYLDLQEMDAVFQQTPLWSNRFFSLSWFPRKDFFDGEDYNLYDAVANYVEAETGRRPSGAIRMLTNLRYFGFIINPITCYYCFDKTGKILETVVADVTNTPWGERHHYILDMNSDSDDLTESNDPINTIEGSTESAIDSPHRMKAASVTFDKAMHVSPFQPMNLVYQWRGKQPTKQLAIHLDVFVAEDVSRQKIARVRAANSSASHPNTSNVDVLSPVFDATLLLERQPMTTQSMNKKILYYPFMTIKVFVSIYWQAFTLWRKKIPFYSAPHYKPATYDK